MKNLVLDFFKHKILNSEGLIKLFGITYEEEFGDVTYSRREIDLILSKIKKELQDEMCLRSPEYCNGKKDMMSRFEYLLSSELDKLEKDRKGL